MSKIQYPRICECCSYTAKNQQSWSQHCKTKKHKTNSGVIETPRIVCEPCEPVTSQPSIQSLLEIIATQAQTIATQAQTIMQLQNVTPSSGDISNNVYQPNITFQITEKDNVRVESPIIEPEPEPEIDNAVTFSEVLDKGIDIRSVVNNYEDNIRKYMVHRLLNDYTSIERPIRFKNDKWSYKDHDNTWIEGNAGDIKREINKKIESMLTTGMLKFQEDNQHHMDNFNERIGMLYMSYARHGTSKIDIFGNQGLTESNCKVE